MLRKNACDRCNGDLYLEDGFDGPELVCLQCGHRRFVTATRVPIPPARNRAGRTKARL